MRRLTLASLLCLSLTGTAAADIRIVAVGPMTGAYQSLGLQIRVGVQKAADDLNAAGGINGEQISVDVEDDACKAEPASAAANRAVGRSDVLAVGVVCAEAATAAAPVYASAGMTMISPAVTALSFTDKRAGPSVFRLGPRDDAQGPAAGSYLAAHFADSRIAIINDGSPYGKTLADATRTAMNAAGLHEARLDTYDAGARDYGALTDRLVADAIDVVFASGYQGDIAVIAKGLRARGSTAVIMGGDALATSEYSTAAGDAAEGTLVTFFSDARQIPAAQSVAGALRAAGTEPEGFVLPSYAAVQVWAAARRSAGANGADIASFIAGNPIPTVLGEAAFDGKGDSKLPGFTVYRWHNGVLVQAGSP